MKLSDWCFQLQSVLANRERISGIHSCCRFFWFIGSRAAETEEQRGNRSKHQNLTETQRLSLTHRFTVKKVERLGNADQHGPKEHKPSKNTLNVFKSS